MNIKGAVYHGGGACKGGGGGAAGILPGPANVNPTFTPYASAINVLSDTIELYDPITGFFGVNTATPARRYHSVMLNPANNATVYNARFEATLAPLANPVVGFGVGVEFWGKGLTGTNFLYGTIESKIRASSSGLGVCGLSFYGRDDTATNRLMMDLLPSTIDPRDNRAIIYAATTIQMSGAGGGANNMPFSLTRTDQATAAAWGITIPITIMDSTTTPRVAARFNFEWADHVAGTSRTYFYGMSAAAPAINLTLLNETAALYKLVPEAIFDIWDGTALKTLPHLLFTGFVVNPITSYLPADAFGGILCAGSGSGYTVGGTILRGISTGNAATGLFLEGFCGGVAAAAYPVILRAGQHNGAGAVAELSTGGVCFDFKNYNRTIFSIMTQGSQAGIGVGGVAESAYSAIFNKYFNGGNSVSTRNTTSGGGAYCEFGNLQDAASAVFGIFRTLSAGYTTSGIYAAGSTMILASGALRLHTLSVSPMVFGINSVAVLHLTTTPEIEFLKDCYWVGSGVGLPYGSCYGNEIAWSQATAVQNTWYNISDTDMTDGNGGLNLVTHDGSGLLTVSKAGRYRITYSVTVESNTADDHIQSGIELNGTGTAIDDGQTHYQATADKEFTLSSTAIVSLAASGYFEIAVRTTDAGAPTITVSHLNISVEMVGG